MKYVIKETNIEYKSGDNSSMYEIYYDIFGIKIPVLYKNIWVSDFIDAHETGYFSRCKFHSIETAKKYMNFLTENKMKEIKLGNCYGMMYFYLKVGGKNIYYYGTSLDSLKERYDKYCKSKIVSKKSKFI